MGGLGNSFTNAIALDNRARERWFKDPDTGFLYQENMNVERSFTLEKKKEFLDVYKANFPNVKASCEVIGISTALYYHHLRFDDAFKSAIYGIRTDMTDRVESAMFQVAIVPKPSHFMDRIAWLRAYRADSFTEKKILVNEHRKDQTDILSKLKTLPNVIDSELVSQEPGPSTCIPDRQALESGDGLQDASIQYSNPVIEVPAAGSDQQDPGIQAPA